MSRHGRLASDRRSEIALTGTSVRHALENTPEADAIADLKLIAQGRSDLLAEAAGGMLGAWLASPGTQHPARLRAVWLLVAAGADPTAITGWTDVSRARMEAPGHRTHGAVDSDD